jgi:hypothetical protein
MFTSRDSPCIKLYVLTKGNCEAQSVALCLCRQNSTAKNVGLFPCTYVYVLTSEDENRSDRLCSHVFSISYNLSPTARSSRSYLHRDVPNKRQAAACNITRHRVLVFTNQSCKPHHQFRSLLNRDSRRLSLLERQPTQPETQTANVKAA